jgi:hypothetical protein
VDVAEAANVEFLDLYTIWASMQKNHQILPHRVLEWTRILNREE